jgi:diaminopimelate epimerase
MNKIPFYKLQASGNDFVLIDANRYPLTAKRLGYKKVARMLCQRKFGIGADGLLAIEKSKKAHFKMRIFNADGSEAEMCGNGARCVALWAHKVRRTTDDGRRTTIRFDTVAGIIEAEVKGKSGDIKIKTSDPFGVKFDMPLKVLGKTIKVNFINTGVPHTVIFVQGLNKIDVDTIGRALRFHRQFQPAGTNVNFVELVSHDTIKIRTYERGVEAETLACGTGSVAAAIIASHKIQRHTTHDTRHRFTVKTKGGETLNVYFDRVKNKIKNVWLEGKAQLIYRGKIIL